MVVSKSLVVSLFAFFSTANAIGSGSAGGANWRYFAAGGLSAATSHGITTPVDVVKTKMQLNPAKYGTNIMKATNMLVKEEGVGFLAQGLAPTVVGYGIEGAMKFGFYELFKPIFAQLTPSQFLNFLLASVVAGAVASIVLCPCEDARIRMVSDPNFAGGLIDALIKLLREDGFFALFAGLSAMLAKQIPYTMSKQVSFDIITSLLYKALATTSIKVDSKVRGGITLGAAAITSVLSCISSQPGDTILTETYKHHGSSSSLLGTSRRIYQEKGMSGFFLGLRPRFAHVGLIITSQLAIYDYAKQACGLAPTGSH